MKRIFVFCLLLCASQGYAQDVIHKDLSESSNVEDIFTVVPTMPHFGNNNEDLQPFIRKHSQYPVSPTRTETSRNVFVQVIIELDGRVTFEKIARGVSKKYDAEVKRLVENMPKWTPGLDGKGFPARVRLMFPVWFK